MVNTFPRNIYQVWFQGCEVIEREEFSENVKNWETLNPEWNYFCLSDRDLREECRKYSDECLAVYDSYKVMHQKIDFGRYVTVYNNGGIYVDMDAYAVRSLNYSSYVNHIIDSYEKDGKDMLGLSKLGITYLEAIIVSTYYNNAIMMSTPKNPTLGEYIEFVIAASKLDQTQTHWFDHDAVQATTGPRTFNKFFWRKSMEDKIVGFPSHVFEPCRVGGVCDLNKETVSAHQFEASWLPAPLKTSAGFYNRNKSAIPFIILIIVLLYFMYRQHQSCAVPGASMFSFMKSAPKTVRASVT